MGLRTMDTHSFFKRRSGKQGQSEAKSGHPLTFLKLLSVLSLSDRWTFLSVCPLQQEMNFEKVGFNNKCLSTL